MNRIRDIFRADDIDPESRNRALLVGGLIAVVVFALALIAVGYYVDRIASQDDTVFSVGERDFSYAYLEDRVKAANAEGTFNTSNVSLGIAETISNIQNEELTRLIAEEQGISLTDEELDEGMKADVGVPSTADRNAFAAALRNRLQFIGLDFDRYREMIGAQVLEEKIQDNLEADLPAEMEQVDLNVILVETDAAAAGARERINGGEDFATVAQEVSQHSSAAEGGDLGWTPRDLLIEELAEPAFQVEVGELSDVIETERGFYVIRVDGRETRELDEEMKQSLVRTYFGDRLEAASEQYEIQNLLTIEQAQRIANQLRVSGG